MGDTNEEEWVILERMGHGQEIAFLDTMTELPVDGNEEFAAPRVCGIIMPPVFYTRCVFHSPFQSACSSCVF